MSLFSEAFYFIAVLMPVVFVCTYDDVLYHVLEKLLMISFESSSEATAIRIRES